MADVPFPTEAPHMDTTKPFFSPDDLDFDALRAAWQGVDVGDIGRLLRSHLVVEHYMNLHLRDRNPHLADFDDARLSFNQKLTLLGNAGPMSLLHHGIRQLNKLRNKVAHQLAYAVTPADLEALFNPGNYFRDFLSTWCEAKGLANPTPFDTLEAFANFATLWLHTGTRLNQKMKEFEAEFDAERAQLAAERIRLATDQGRLEGNQETLAAWRASLVETYGEPTDEEEA